MFLTSYCFFQSSRIRSPKTEDVQDGFVLSCFFFNFKPQGKKAQLIPMATYPGCEMPRLVFITCTPSYLFQIFEVFCFQQSQWPTKVCKIAMNLGIIYGINRNHPNISHRILPKLSQKVALNVGWPKIDRLIHRSTFVRRNSPGQVVFVILCCYVGSLG